MSRLGRSIKELSAGSGGYGCWRTGVVRVIHGRSNINGSPDHVRDCFPHDLALLNVIDRRRKRKRGKQASGRNKGDERALEDGGHCYCIGCQMEMLSKRFLIYGETIVV